MVGGSSIGGLSDRLSTRLDIAHEELLEQGKRIQSYKTLDECVEAGDCKIGEMLIGPGEITGITKHAVNQMISREGVGVATRAALDAIKNPVKIIVNEGRGSIKYVGKSATVVLSKAGVIITTWARNAAGFRIIP